MERIRELLDQSGPLTDGEVSGMIDRELFEYSSGSHYLTAAEKRELSGRLFAAFRGLDALQPLIDDPDVSEIMVNGHRHIFIERKGAVTRHDRAFDSEEKLLQVIQSIVSKVNRTINEASPIVDARLADGSRVHAVIPPVALDGPTLTIRKFPRRPMTLGQLVAIGTLTREAAELLQSLVCAGYNLFIGGGTGSGKTTFLNALADGIPAEERIITIEDSAELNITALPNVVRLETRNANTEGKGEIPIRQLIRASLRMRPNRIIVGEVRGAEALDMLQAMNTGHDGSMSTGHANSPKDMLSRLETMVLSGAALPVEVIRKQICSAIDILVHLSRMRDRSRKVVAICELDGMENGEIRLNPLFRYEEGAGGAGREIGGLKATGSALRKCEKLAAYQVKGGMA